MEGHVRPQVEGPDLEVRRGLPAGGEIGLHRQLGVLHGQAVEDAIGVLYSSPPTRNLAGSRVATGTGNETRMVPPSAARASARGNVATAPMARRLRREIDKVDWRWRMHGLQRMSLHSAMQQGACQLWVQLLCSCWLSRRRQKAHGMRLAHMD